jgi:hypothetical protein
MLPQACGALFNGYGSRCSVVCGDGRAYINQARSTNSASHATASACIVVDTHSASEASDALQRLQSPCASMRSSAFILSSFRSAALCLIVNLAFTAADAASLSANALLSRCDCTASCSCQQPALQLRRGRLLLHVPRDAHIMLASTGSSRNGNILVILSRSPVRHSRSSPPSQKVALFTHPPQVDGLVFGANSAVQHHGLTLHDSRAIFEALPNRPGSGYARCQLR